MIYFCICAMEFLLLVLRKIDVMLFKFRPQGILHLSLYLMTFLFARRLHNTFHSGYITIIWIRYYTMLTNWIFQYPQGNHGFKLYILNLIGMFFNIFIGFNLLILLLYSTLQLIQNFHINSPVNFIVCFYQQFMTNSIIQFLQSNYLKL